MRIRVIVVVFAAVLLSCAGRGASPLVFAVGGTPNEFGFWEELVADFTRSSGIKVELLRQPTHTDQRRQSLVTALRSRQSNPDVFLMDVAWLGQFAAADWLETLGGDILGAAAPNDVFFPRILDLADTYDGNLLALPVYVDAGLLYYRKDLLEKYGISGPPATWKDLTETASRVQTGERAADPRFYGFVWQGAQYEGLMCTFLEFAGSNGGGITIDETRVIIDTPANVHALAFMRGLVRESKVSPPNTFTEMKEEEVRIVFQNGSALFQRNWPYAWALHQSGDSEIRGKVGIAPLPHFNGGESVSTLGGWHIGVSRYSDRKEQSRELLRFLCSYEAQKRCALRLGWNPGRMDVYLDPEILEKLPHFADLKSVFENARPRPGVPYYSQVSEIIQKEINSALAGTISPGEALQRAQAQAEQLVRRYQGS